MAAATAVQSSLVLEPVHRTEPAPDHGSAERLPDAFTINFGNAEVLSEFCLRADRRIHEEGIDLYLSRDLSHFNRINQQNLDTWHRILPAFNPAFGAATPENSYFIYGVDRSDGEIVATVAGHVYLTDDLNEMIRSLRFFYDDPQRHAEAGEECRFSAEAEAMAKGIEGRVVFSGGGWFRPGKARRKGYAKIIPRLSRAYARATWGTDYTFSLVMQPHLQIGIARAYGYSLHAHAWQWTKPSATAAGHPVPPLVLVWMPTDELENDLNAWNLADRERDMMSMAADD